MGEKGQKTLFYYDLDSLKFYLPYHKREKKAQVTRDSLNSGKSTPLYCSTISLNSIGTFISHQTNRYTSGGFFVENDFAYVVQSDSDMPPKIDILEKKSFCLFKFDRTGKGNIKHEQDLVTDNIYCVCCNNVCASIFEFLRENDHLQLIETNKNESSYLFESTNKFPVPLFENVGQLNGYYNEYFSNYDYAHFSCKHPKHGPVLFSISRKLKRLHSNSQTVKTINKKRCFGDLVTAFPNVMRVVVRTTCPYGLYIGVPYQEKMNEEAFDFEAFLKKILKNYFPTLLSGEFRRINESQYHSINKIDEINKKYFHKIGIILCLQNQKTEEEMYENNVCTESFYKFLKAIAFEVELKGFKNYSGGLDTQNDHTGSKSFYINFYGHEIMFHVACFLPYEDNCKVQVQRKRHIGNDTVTIIFQEKGDHPIDISTFVSQFQKTFILVREIIDESGNLFYEVAYSAYNDVPCFHQLLKPRYNPLDDSFQKMFLTLVLNAEFASKQCLKMKSASCKGNEVILNSFCSDQCGSQTFLPKSEKTSSVSNSSGAVIRGKLPGGCAWSVFLLSYRYWTNVKKSILNILCELVVSQRFVVFLSSNDQEVIMKIPICRILGWNLLSHSKITMYMSGKYSVSFLLAGPDLLESQSLMKLLVGVTRGNNSTTVTIIQEEFKNLNIKTNDMGKIISIDNDDDETKSYGLCKDSYILEVNKRLMGPRGTKIFNKILNMKDPYHITFCPPLKPIFNEYSIFPEPQISCEIE